MEIPIAFSMFLTVSSIAPPPPPSRIKAAETSPTAPATEPSSLATCSLSKASIDSSVFLICLLTPTNSCFKSLKALVPKGTFLNSSFNLSASSSNCPSEVVAPFAFISISKATFSAILYYIKLLTIPHY